MKGALVFAGLLAVGCGPEVVIDSDPFDEPRAPESDVGPEGPQVVTPLGEPSAPHPGQVPGVGGARDGLRTLMRLASGQESLRGLAVDGGMAVWLSENTPAYTRLMRVAEGMNPEPAAVGFGSAMGFVLDGDRAFWTDPASGDVRYVDLLTGTHVRLASGEPAPLGLVVWDEVVYWGNADGKIRRVSTAGGTVESVASLGQLPAHMAVDDKYVYVATAEGDLFRILMADGTTERIAGGQSFGTPIVVDQNYLYWGNDLDRSIKRMGKEGLVVATVATGQYAPRGITVDALYIYFTTDGDGALKRVRRDDGPVEVLVSGLGAGGDVAREGSDVTFTDPVYGSVYRLSL